MDFVYGVIDLKELGKLCVKLIKICLNCIVFTGLDRGAGDYNATGIDDSENGVSTAYVDSDYIRFAHCFY